MSDVFRREVATSLHAAFAPQDNGRASAILSGMPTAYYLCLVEWNEASSSLPAMPGTWTWEAALPRSISEALTLVNEIERDSARVTQVLCISANVSKNKFGTVIDVTEEVARVGFADWKAAGHDVLHDRIPRFLLENLPADVDAGYRGNGQEAESRIREDDDGA